MIEVKYTCEGCGIVKRPVNVPARSTESVTDWMKGVVVRIIAEDHRATSPGCKSTRIKDLLIPVPDGTQFVGQQVD